MEAGEEGRGGGLSGWAMRMGHGAMSGFGGMERRGKRCDGFVVKVCEVR